MLICCSSTVCTIFLVLFYIMRLQTSYWSLKSSWNFNETRVSVKVERVPLLLWKSRERKTVLVTNRTCDQYYHLLVLVSSAPAHLDRRENIRKTWAFDELNRRLWKTVFIVGQTKLKALSQLLLKEEKDFEDLVRGDYNDHYDNLTFKIQTGFEWAVNYCEFSFLLKVDDDCFVHPLRLVSYFNRPTAPSKGLYTGNLMHKLKPLRHKGGKWSVTYEQYGDYYYPDFCSGFGFVLSHDVVALFVEVLDLIPVFRIDDVYVGLLAKETGIIATHSTGFEPSVSSPNELCIPLSSTLVRHGTLGECREEIFKRSIIKAEQA